VWIEGDSPGVEFLRASLTHLLPAARTGRLKIFQNPRQKNQLANYRKGRELLRPERSLSVTLGARVSKLVVSDEKRCGNRV
jgi:hypothetical protein